MYDALIFDCDGVLVDSEVIGLNETTEYLQGKGFSWSAADIIRLFTGMRGDILAERLTEEYASVLGRAPTETEMSEVAATMMQHRRQNRHKMTEVNGATALSRSLSVLPAKRAVASSSRKTFLDDKLQRFGMWDFYSPHVYSAELVEHGKPAPDIFLYAAEKLGVLPVNCLVIEDSVNGVIAGKAAGMTVWGFVGGGHCFEDHADHLLAAGASLVASDHEHLRESLRALY